MELMSLGFENNDYDARNINDTDEVSPYGEASFGSEDEDLEIFKKADRFKSINLLSGNGMSNHELDSYVLEHYGKLGMQRLKMGRFILKSLGYQLSPDVLLMLSCTKRFKAVIATAGAGKTTSLQFDLLISKMLDKALGEELLTPELIEGTSISVPRILYLNYNKHNVSPIEIKHKAMCAAVNKIISECDAIDDSIDSSTVHAFCHRWLRAFSTEIEMPELSIITEEQKEKVWSSIITPRWKKFYNGEDCDIEYTVLDELYTFKTESMLDWDSFFDTAKFVDSDLKQDFVKSCIQKYDSMKKQMKLMDFTDYLVLMTKVLRENEGLRKKLQRRYRIIIADENQDFTMLMNELLVQLYDKDINKLIVVGDPDQTIYAFKGVSPDNVVSLVSTLDDAEVMGLDINYRCPNVIVDAAKKILNLNILRFDKPINTIRIGGKIISHPLNQGMSQDAEVISLLNRIGRNEFGNTVITYRNNISSVTIAEELYYSGIPFNILDDRRPFSNTVFKHITNALKALRDKDDYDLNIGLYRFMPLSKEQWVSILDFNKRCRRNHLHDLEIPSGLPRGTLDVLKTLVRVSELIATQPICDFIQPLVKLYRTYYLNFMIKSGGFATNDTDSLLLYLERTIKFYSRQMLFEYMMEELSERNRDNPAGVTLSTFHGLKGLEFNYVIAIDFTESIFPNYYSIEQKYSLNTAMEEKESENRLCYVLVTRTIKEMHMFYTATDPSVYVGLLSNPESGTEREELTLNSLSDGTGIDSKLSFINRLLGDRGSTGCPF